MKPSSLLWTLFILLMVCSAYAYIIFAITLTGGRLLDLSDYFFFAAMALIGWVTEVFFVLVLQKERKEKAHAIAWTKSETARSRSRFVLAPSLLFVFLLFRFILFRE